MNILLKLVIFPLIIELFSLSSAYSAESEYSLTFTGEVAAVQNYAFLWVHLLPKEKDKTLKYILDEEPHKLKISYMVVRLAGLSTKGMNEEITIDDGNIKYNIKNEMKKLEGNSFKFECSEIIDNVPVCIMRVTSNSYNQYLLMKGVTKMSSEGLNTTEENTFNSSQEYAKKNKVGVWKPFYGLFEHF